MADGLSLTENGQVKLNVGVLGGFCVCILNPDLNSIRTKPIYTKQSNCVYDVIIYNSYNQSVRNVCE